MTGLPDVKVDENGTTWVRMDVPGLESFWVNEELLKSGLRPTAPHNLNLDLRHAHDTPRPTHP